MDDNSTEAPKKEDFPKDPEYISTIDFVIRDLMKKFGSVFSDGSHVADGIRAGFKEPQRYFRKDGDLNSTDYYDEMIKTIRDSISKIANNQLNLPSQVKLEGVSQEELDNFMKTYGKLPLPLGSSSSEHPNMKYCDDSEKKDNAEANSDEAEKNDNAEANSDEAEKNDNAEATGPDQIGKGYNKRRSRKRKGKRKKQIQSRRRLTT